MKIEMELLRVKAARAELAYKVAEKQEEIRRITSNIVIQDDKIKELEDKLK
jgi:hypothetical protein